MKFYKTTFFTVLMITVIGCSKDDGPKEVPATNSAPKMAIQSFTASEDVSDTEVIGTVTAIDADGDALTFSLVTNDGDLFEITKAVAISLAAVKQLDYEQ